MPRSRKGRQPKVRARRGIIAIASFAVVLAAIGLGRWAGSRIHRVSPKTMEIAKVVPPLPLARQFAPSALIPTRAEIAPMPSVVPDAIAKVEVESEFYPMVPESDAPRGQLKRTPRGFTAYTLSRRIDERAGEALQKELANAAEVGLATPMNPTLAKDLAAVAKRAEHQNRPFAGSVIVARNRPELAGLPFRVGRETLLPIEDARNMNDMSKQFREAITKSLKGKGAEATPDVEKLYEMLSTKSYRAEPKPEPKPEAEIAAVTPWRWNTTEAVPCIQQMIQAEGAELRRMSCELLGQIDSAAATEALVKWAVFDVDAGNRAAAVQALRGRDPAKVGALLMEWARYPWARAVEHACEAMVELGMKENLPGLAALLAEPDPDAPFDVKLPGTGRGAYRREIVRVNHLKNCLMCHPASFQATELVRGAVPDENRILPSPTTPAYYTGSADAIQVSAATTYLRQDFSLAQPVANPGNWPRVQRFDYFVSTQQVDRAVLRTYVPNEESAYKKALRFAIRELAGPGKERDLEWLAGQRKQAAPMIDHRMPAAAQSYALRASPEAFIAFKAAEFTTPIHRMGGPELAAMIRKFETTNPHVLTGTMIAYLEPLIDKVDASERERIAGLLALARTPNLELGEFLGFLSAMR